MKKRRKRRKISRQERLERAIRRFDRRYAKQGGYKVFRRMLESGETLQQIGDHFGFTRQYASLKKKDFHLVPPEKKYRNRRWLYRWYIAEGRSVREISRTCGVHMATIYENLKRTGVSKREKRTS